MKSYKFFQIKGAKFRYETDENHWHLLDFFNEETSQWEGIFETSNEEDLREIAESFLDSIVEEIAGEYLDLIEMNK